MRDVRILFVCMANICRSPTAEGVMRKLIADAGLEHCVFARSAGTHDYHVGEPPDPRAIAAAGRRGYDLSSLRSRQLALADFYDFDLLLAMDFNNLATLQGLRPPDARGQIGLLMPYAKKRYSSIVHDPYYRSAKDFDLVLECIEDACNGLLQLLVAGEAELDLFPAGMKGV